MKLQKHEEYEPSFSSLAMSQASFRVCGSTRSWFIRWCKRGVVGI